MTTTAQNQTVLREKGEHGGRYVIKLEGEDEAVMTYKDMPGDTIAIDHTFVPPRYRGQGHAELLVQKGIDDARAESKMIIPVCSYVAAQFRRHPEWRDLLAP